MKGEHPDSLDLEDKVIKEQMTNSLLSHEKLKGAVSGGHET